MSPWLVILVMGNLLPVVSAAAPGDGHPICTDPTDRRYRPTAPVPLPSNAKILMDSFNYVILLSSDVTLAEAWLAVDRDFYNTPGYNIAPEYRVSFSIYSVICVIFFMQWRQITSRACRQAVAVCGYKYLPQNNWLITQYISRRVGSVLLPQVSVQLLFDLSGCNSASGCQRTFFITILESSIESWSLARETKRYRRVSRLALGERGPTIHNETIQAEFTTDEEGFYLAIHDQGSCITLKRLIVFYHVCPGGPENLVMRPETIAPIGLPPLVVAAQCVDGASLIVAFSGLRCLPGGVWSALPNFMCNCNRGFNTSADRRFCTGRLCLYILKCPITSCFNAHRGLPFLP
jgi:hypothetical protein